MTPSVFVFDSNNDRRRAIVKAIRDAAGQDSASGNQSVFQGADDTSDKAELRPLDEIRLVFLHESNQGASCMEDRVREEGKLLVQYSGGFASGFWEQASESEVRCAVDFVLQNGGVFVKEFLRSGCADWLLLSGVGALEHVLQLLSALLPIGLLWEAHGKCKALQVLKQGDKEGKSSPIEFERLIHRYACGLLGGDCAAADDAWAEIERQHQPALDKLGGVECIKAKLKDLCSANDPMEWNEKLKALRNYLLAKANQ